MVRTMGKRLTHSLLGGGSGVSNAVVSLWGEFPLLSQHTSLPSLIRLELIRGNETHGSHGRVFPGDCCTTVMMVMKMVCFFLNKP